MDKIEEMKNIATLMRIDRKYAIKMGVPDHIYYEQEDTISRSIEQGNLVGMKMAAADIVQDLSDWEDPDMVREFLKDVLKQTSLTAFEIAGNPRKQVSQIRKSGKIKNDLEYYLMKEYKPININEQEEIEKLIELFESQSGFQ